MSLLLRAFVVIALSSVAASCILQRGQKDPSVGVQNDYVGGAVFAATGIGAAVASRKLTGACYASCPPGLACIRETGMCERRTCMCPADQVCEVAGGQVLCTQPRRHEGSADAGDGGAGLGEGGAGDGGAEVGDGGAGDGGAGLDEGDGGS